MEVHLSKGFCFMKSRQPLDSSFLLEESKGERVGPTGWKAQSLLGMHCTGIQEPKMKLFYSLQLPLWPMPTVPVYRICVGKVRGWEGRVRGLKSVSLPGPGVLFQAGERAILFLRAPNGVIISIFWCVQVMYIITYLFLQAMLFFWPS